MKKLVVFDIDNTLTESRTDLDKEMGGLLCELLKKTRVGIISGASFSRLLSQVVSHIECKDCWNNLYLMPVTGTELYVYEHNDWSRKYIYPLAGEKKEAIYNAIIKILGVSKDELKQYAEDKGSQITFAGIGLNASLEDKKLWDPNHKKREALVKKLKPLLPKIHMTMGGTTSIDFTEEGVDKGFGVERLMNYLNLTKVDVEFVGDALYEGGNDNAVIRLGEQVVSTNGPENTKEIIRDMLKTI